MPTESLNGVIGKIESPSGTARVYSVSKMKDLGYDVERLPFLHPRPARERPPSFMGVTGALEAAHSLAGWPGSIGEEMPFMPHRVLLQDYTGVPLVVDPLPE